MLYLGLVYINPWCCDRHPDAPPVDFTRWFTAPLSSPPDAFPKPVKPPKVKKKRLPVRPVKHRGDLVDRLNVWRADTHANDPYRVSGRTATMILDDAYIKALSALAPKRVLMDTVLEVVEEETGSEWADEWVVKVLDVLMKYDEDLVLLQCLVQDSESGEEVKQSDDAGDTVSGSDSDDACHTSGSDSSLGSDEPLSWAMSKQHAGKL